MRMIEHERGQLHHHMGLRARDLPPHLASTLVPQPSMHAHQPSMHAHQPSMHAHQPSTVPEVAAARKSRNTNSCDVDAPCSSSDINTVTVIRDESWCNQLCLSLKLDSFGGVAQDWTYVPTAHLLPLHVCLNAHSRAMLAVATRVYSAAERNAYLWSASRLCKLYTFDEYFAMGIVTVKMAVVFVAVLSKDVSWYYWRVGLRLNVPAARMLLCISAWSLAPCLP